MIGETISHYRLTEKLGQGGMGVVFRAEDLTLRRDVALKLLPDGLAVGEDARRGMLREARLASRLNHPNIATIYEVAERSECPYIAMELVDGHSLREVLNEGPIAPSRALHIGRQIADGLGEAHRAGVLHRDMKPANVMVDHSDSVKILDFGLGSLAIPERLEGEDSKSFIHRSMAQMSSGGTVPYMPPEQLKGEPPDHRSDIFSLGVVLYECLTGMLPFAGETAVDIMFAILRKDPAEVSSVSSEISPLWDTLIGRCLEKDPTRRVSDMGELLRSLEEMAKLVSEGAGALNQDGAAGQPELKEKTLAVLYFQNLSHTDEDEYFRDGMTEDIITELSQIRDLRVLSPNAVVALKGSSATVQEIGQSLGADHVLEGSLRRAGDRLRITARLVETRSSHSVWAKRYDRQMQDVFAIQDEIAQSIAEALRLVLTEEEKAAIEKVPTDDVQAYDFYLKGRQHLHRFNREGFEYARQMFARAVALDPGYAKAYAGVAYGSAMLYEYWEPAEANLKEADEASRKALELDPDLAESHVARGMVLKQSERFDEAEVEFKKGIELDSDLFEAHYFYGRAFLAQGKLEEASRLFEEASRVQPEDYQSPILLATLYKALRQPKEAVVTALRGLEAAEKRLELDPSDARAVYLGACAHCIIGDADQAIEWAGRAVELEPNEGSILYNVACTYSSVGEFDKAMDCLESAVAQGYCSTEWLQNDPTLEDLRSSPRMKALLENM
ncbi:MAG: protein kinase domain-containing protein [Planctomycetota bacterium]|jgi:non-specific serine/threonine protein kinase